jgi:hypothetical protein
VANPWQTLPQKAQFKRAHLLKYAIAAKMIYDKRREPKPKIMTFGKLPIT